MKKYSEYKDSGIDWIGEIPEHWDSKKFSYLLKYSTGFTPSTSNDDYYRNGTHDWVTIADLKSHTVTDSKTKITDLAVEGKDIIPEGSLLYSFKLSVGKMAFAGKDIFTNEAIFSVQPEKEINLKYFYYLLGQILHFNSNENIYGAKILNQELIKASIIINPPQNEQTVIANYLDKKTAEIDALIEKKQQLIQLYKEERTATINQAVTKGLDPNVPLKDSGIEWLGEIPEHWEVKRVDWASNIVRGNSSFKRDELLGSGKYIALQYGKTYKVDVVDDSFNFFVNDEFYKESQVVSRGDTILISTSETVEDLGHSCYYDNENIGLIGGEQILLKPNRDILDEKYLYYYTIQLGNLLRKYAKGLKVYRFNTNDLKKLFFAIPSKEEQETISTFLDQKAIELDDLVSKSEQEIELLKEYKTALISEVVLGKVDVREELKNA